MRKIIMVLLLLLGCLLMGCSAVEPENRAFPLIMSIDYLEGSYQVIYGLPDLSKTTGQNKTGETGSDDDRTTVYTGKTLADIEKEFDKSQKNYLDLGHLKVLLVGNGLLNHTSAWEECLGFLEENPRIAGNTYVFSCDTIKELMGLNGNEIDSLGEFLTGIFENKPVSHKENAVELRELYNAWHNEEEYPILQTAEVRGTQVFIE